MNTLHHIVLRENAQSVQNRDTHHIPLTGGADGYTIQSRDLLPIEVDSKTAYTMAEDEEMHLVPPTYRQHPPSV